MRDELTPWLVFQIAVVVGFGIALGQRLEAGAMRAIDYATHAIRSTAPPSGEPVSLEKTKG